MIVREYANMASSLSSLSGVDEALRQGKIVMLGRTGQFLVNAVANNPKLNG
jgi:hypothetical protein